MVTISTRGEADSPYARLRLATSLLIMTIGGAGMYAMSVALPPIQAEFGVARGNASLPYTFTMLGFAVGGIFMGRLSDRYGVMVPVLISALTLGCGYIAAGMATSLLYFTLAHGFLIGMGSSGTFAPLVADTTLWFNRNRGMAVAICASGNYLSGTVWPPVLQYFFDMAGWRATYIGAGILSFAVIVPLAFVLHKRPPALALPATGAKETPRPGIDLAPKPFFLLLAIAGVSCCIAMSVPQVHIVAYCMDIGYGARHGANMLAVMLGVGILSRLASGWLADRIGGFPTLLLNSAVQAIALFLFVPFDGLASLYAISILFGLQGGLIPSYAIVIREFFKPSEVGARVGILITATLTGMAFGGWLSGAIFDYTGSYRYAFWNGFAWNLVNLVIIGWLMRRTSMSLRTRQA